MRSGLEITGCCHYHSGQEGSQVPGFGPEHIENYSDYQDEKDRHRCDAMHQ